MAALTDAADLDVRVGEFPLALTFDGISKRFGGQLAVYDVSFSIGVGQVHALVGENGAGKSTLIKILSGEHRQDAGTISIRGDELDIGHPWERRALGVSFIHQEPALFPTMTIAENILLGEGFRDTRFSFIPWSRQYAIAAEALARVGLDVDPRAQLDTLSVAERQLVAVASLLISRQRVVVFDEPTASLTEKEATTLFSIIREMRNQGVAILYVSHRMEEIFALADKVTVMKDGKYVVTRETASLTPATLAQLIIGEDSGERPGLERPVSAVTHEKVLEVRGLTDEVLRDVSFDVHGGEVLGIAGLAGAGRSNILSAIFGSSRPTGEIRFRGEVLTLKHPADAIARGIVMVTEDRKHDGFVPTFSIWQTITLPWLRRFSRFGWLNLRGEVRSAGESMKRFDVRAVSAHASISDLSGGNQQKAILARWLSQDINLVLLDEPTHGVDVGAKSEIYAIVHNIASTGTPVVVVSSELEELEGLCSRVILLSRGRTVGELHGDEITKPQMLRVLFAEHPRNGSEE